MVYNGPLITSFINIKFESKQQKIPVTNAEGNQRSTSRGMTSAGGFQGWVDVIAVMMSRGWDVIGVEGQRSCGEMTHVVHLHIVAGSVAAIFYFSQLYATYWFSSFWGIYAIHVLLQCGPAKPCKAPLVCLRSKAGAACTCVPKHLWQTWDRR